MTFWCPGCKQPYPIDEGQLVIHQPDRPKHTRGRFNMAERTVAILCTPCTADIVLARAGICR